MGKIRVGWKVEVHEAPIAFRGMGPSPSGRRILSAREASRRTPKARDSLGRVLSTAARVPDGLARPPTGLLWCFFAVSPCLTTPILLWSPNVSTDYVENLLRSLAIVAAAALPACNGGPADDRDSADARSPADARSSAEGATPAEGTTQPSDDGTRKPDCPRRGSFASSPGRRT